MSLPDGWETDVYTYPNAVIRWFRYTKYGGAPRCMNVEDFVTGLHKTGDYEEFLQTVRETLADYPEDQVVQHAKVPGRRKKTDLESNRSRAASGTSTPGRGGEEESEGPRRRRGRPTKEEAEKRKAAERQTSIKHSEADLESSFEPPVAGVQGTAVDNNTLNRRRIGSRSRVSSRGRFGSFGGGRFGSEDSFPAGSSLAFHNSRGRSRLPSWRSGSGASDDGQPAKKKGETRMDHSMKMDRRTMHGPERREI